MSHSYGELDEPPPENFHLERCAWRSELSAYSGADSACWAVEGREEAVAGGVALLPSEPAELSAHDRMVFGEKVSPRPIADLCDTFC